MTFMLNDKLFHSPVSNLQFGWSKEKDLEIKMLKLERIFSSRLIMCRDTLKQIYPESLFFSQKNYNQDKYVSLSKHISQKNEEDMDPNHIIFSDETAWEMYPLNEISFVLNQSLYKENPKYLLGVRIPLEVQVQGDIDLKYLEAISIPAICGIQPFFKGKDYDIQDCLKSYLDSKKYYYMLETLLKFVCVHNIHVPIVDIETGIQYCDNSEYRQLIKKYNK